MNQSDPIPAQTTPYYAIQKTTGKHTGLSVSDWSSPGFVMLASDTAIDAGVMNVMTFASATQAEAWRHAAFAPSLMDEFVVVEAEPHVTTVPIPIPAISAHIPPEPSTSYFIVLEVRMTTGQFQVDYDQTIEKPIAYCRLGEQREGREDVVEFMTLGRWVRDND